MRLGLAAICPGAAFRWFSSQARSRRDAGDWNTLCVILLISGLCERMRGQLDQAEVLLRESTGLAVMVGFWGLITNTTALAGVSVQNGTRASSPLIKETRVIPGLSVVIGVSRSGGGKRGRVEHRY